MKRNPGILLQEERAASAAEAMRAELRNQGRGWNALGGFGLLLTVLGLLDVGLYFYPPAFSSPEWEFGVVTSAVSSLPMPTIGLAAVVGWLLVRGGRGGRIVGAVVLTILVMAVAAGLVLFLLDVPLALKAADGPQGPAIYRAIIRTLAMGAGFGGAYGVAAFTLLRRSRRETLHG